MLARLALVGTTVALLSVLAGCGTPALGEACSGSPQTGGCDEGAYCVLDRGGPVRGDEGDPTWNTYSCRQSCSTHRDCEAGFLCEAVPTTPTLYACQPIAP